jgi:hypothetical protein
MAQVQLSLIIQPKWWMWPALVVGLLALKLGLVRDAPSAEHYDGIITAEERVSRWLANFAFRFEVR